MNGTYAASAWSASYLLNVIDLELFVAQLRGNSKVANLLSPPKLVLLLSQEPFTLAMACATLGFLGSILPKRVMHNGRSALHLRCSEELRETGTAAR